MFLNQHRLDYWVKTFVGGADPATTAWVAAVVAAGGTVSAARQILVNNLIVGLRADGLFSKLDHLWLHAAENTQSALIDIVADTAASPVNAPLFTANQGYTFDGATNYLNLNVNPSTAGGNYTLNSGHLGAYLRTVDGAAANACVIGLTDSTSFIQLIVITTLPRSGFYLNDATGTNPAVDIVAGMLVGSRTASNVTALYSNGVIVGSPGAAVSVSIPNLVLFEGARNDALTPDLFSPLQQAVICFGGGLNATEAANLSSRINAYMTAIGTNVY